MCFAWIWPTKRLFSIKAESIVFPKKLLCQWTHRQWLYPCYCPFSLSTIYVSLSLCFPLAPFPSQHDYSLSLSYPVHTFVLLQYPLQILTLFESLPCSNRCHFQVLTIFISLPWSNTYPLIPFPCLQMQNTIKHTAPFSAASLSLPSLGRTVSRCHCIVVQLLMFLSIVSFADALAFTIPQTYHTSPVLTRVRGFTDIQSRAATSPRDFCLKSKSLENVAGNLTRPSIGHVSLEIWYSQEDELLMIRLLRVDLLAKPSAAVISSTWQVRPEVKVCLLHEKRKFWESGQSKAPCTLVPHSVTFIHIKKGTVKEQVLKLTVLDSLRKNEKTPIGFVFVTFNDIDLTWKSSSYVREIVPSSEVNFICFYHSPLFYCPLFSIDTFLPYFHYELPPLDT